MQVVDFCLTWEATCPNQLRRMVNHHQGPPRVFGPLSVPGLHRVLGPHRFLGPHRILGPPGVLDHLSVLGPVFPVCLMTVDQYSRASC